MKHRRVAILGMGLMGGSLGLALRSRGGAETVAGYARRAETRAAALAAGAADEMPGSAADTVRGADLVVCCTPVLSIPAVLRECLPALKPGCVVTDVGSTKAELMHAVAPVLAGHPVHFVGSHPMAGSEKTGLDHASARLYEGAMVFVTPDGTRVPGDALETVVALWSGVGARVMVLEAGDHDRFVARTSHLPHLVAAVLASTVGREGAGDLRPFCGPGFRDTTRVAAGSADVWHDIIKSNRGPVLAELQACREELERLQGLIEQGAFDALRRYLEASAEHRRTLMRRTDGPA